MIAPVQLHAPSAADFPPRPRCAAAPGRPGRAEPQSSISDARDPLIKDKPTFPQLSNHNSDIGKSLTGPHAEPATPSPQPVNSAGPLADAAAAAASAHSATQTIRSQPGTAWLAQANVLPSRAQRILS